MDDVKEEKRKRTKEKNIIQMWEAASSQPVDIPLASHKTL